jgi:predicted RecA/RadA family phage recombinase
MRPVGFSDGHGHKAKEGQTMKNFVSAGTALALTAPSGGVVAGSTVKIGSVLAVPAQSAVEGEAFTGHVEGIFDVPATTGTAWAEGDLLYWDDTAKKYTKAASGNTKAGVAVLAKLSAAGEGRIRLVPTI